MNEKWRVIALSQNSGAMNMAIDEAVSHFVNSNESLPTIRFYTWKPSCVTIGYHQSMTDEVDTEKCKELGIDVVRRLTGGGSVYHDSDGEITYSIIARQELFEKGIIESYKQICAWIIDGLEELGLKAEFKPINDIIVNNRKISGNAQTRRANIICQHGTILYKLDVATMFSVLKISKEKISDKLIKSVEQRVTSIKNEGDIEFDLVYQSLLKSFTKNKDFEFGKLSEPEYQLAKKLEKEKYLTNDWNFKR